MMENSTSFAKEAIAKELKNGSQNMPATKSSRHVYESRIAAPSKCGRHKGEVGKGGALPLRCFTTHLARQQTAWKYAWHGSGLPTC